MVDLTRLGGKMSPYNCQFMRLIITPYWRCCSTSEQPSQSLGLSWPWWPPSHSRLLMRSLHVLHTILPFYLCPSTTSLLLLFYLPACLIPVEDSVWGQSSWPSAFAWSACTLALFSMPPSASWANGILWSTSCEVGCSIFSCMHAHSHPQVA